MTSLRQFDQIELERQRRMRECFEATQPDQFELVQAVQRWHRAKAQRVSAGRLKLAWVAACAVMLSGAAMAASNRGGLPNWITHAVKLRGASSTKGPSSTSYVVERAGKRVQYQEPTELALAPGETAAFVIDGTRTELQGPAAVRVKEDGTAHGWITRFEPQGWAPVAPAPAASPAGSAAPDLATSQQPQPASERNAPAKAPPQIDQDTNLPAANADLAFGSRELKGAWERAASAMRQGNQRAAIIALTEISQSADSNNRDAALLAKAQLDMAAGRRDLALAALRNLASTGATAFIRQRATEILASGK